METIKQLLLDHFAKQLPQLVMARRLAGLLRTSQDRKAEWGENRVDVVKLSALAENDSEKVGQCCMYVVLQMCETPGTDPYEV